MGRRKIAKDRIERALAIWERYGWTMQGLAEASRRSDISERKLYYARAEGRKEQNAQNTTTKEKEDVGEK